MEETITMRHGEPAAPVGWRSLGRVDDPALSCLLKVVQWPPSRLGRPGVNQVRMPAQVQIHGEQVVTESVPPARTRRLFGDPVGASEADDEAAYSAFFRANFAGVTRTVYLIVHDSSHRAVRGTDDGGSGNARKA